MKISRSFQTAFCLLIILLLAFTAMAKEEVSTLANPMAEYSSISAAKTAAGVDFPIPSRFPEGFLEEKIFLIAGSLLHVTYQQGNTEICFRAQKKSDAPKSSDISGVYTKFPQVWHKKIHGMDVTLKGNGEQFSLALWQRGVLAFSLYINGDGLSEMQLCDIIESI